MNKWFLVIVAFVSNIAFGQLSFDKTRIIFDESKGRSQSIRVINNNPVEPYLAQSWLENGRGEKISAPLIALPILQRLEPKQEKQIKVTFTGGGAQLLSQDQETLLSFKVLGMPPKSQSGKNEVQIIVTNDLKLFYRPKGLQKYTRPNGWLYEANIERRGKDIILQNPTAYHMVLMGHKSSAGRKLTEEYRVIKPFSTEKINITAGNSLHMSYMGDQGGAVEVRYNCSTSQCQLIEIDN